MAVAFGTNITGGNVAVSAATSISTTALTVASGATLLVVTAIWQQSSEATAVSGISGTWGSQALTLGPFVADPSLVKGACAILTLVNPATGAQTLTLEWTSAQDCYMGACTFTGTDTTTGIKTADSVTAQGTGTSTTSLAVNTASTDATVAVFGNDGSTPTTNFTKLWGYDSDSPGGAASYELGGTTSNTHTFTGGGGSQAHIAGVHVLAAGSALVALATSASAGQAPATGAGVLAALGASQAVAKVIPTGTSAGSTSAFGASLSSGIGAIAGTGALSAIGVAVSAALTSAAPVPTPVQHVVYSTNGTVDGTPGNAFEYPVRNATLANNCLVLKIYYAYSGNPTISITDNIGNTWPTTPAEVATDTSNGVKLAVFVLPGATAGVTLITVTFSAAVYHMNASFMEFYNVATSSPLDVGAAAQVGGLSSGGTVASGSITTTVAGDLILHFVQDDDDQSFGGQQDGLTLLSPASGFKLVHAELSQGYACQYAVQSTAGAVNPAITLTASGSGMNWTSVTLALKAAPAGTAPSASAMRIFGLVHTFIMTTSGTHSYPVQFPTVGNLLAVLASQRSTTTSLGSISGSVSGSWTVPSGASGAAQGAYLTSATSGNGEVLTLSLDQKTGTPNFMALVFDVVNGGAFDTFVSGNNETSFPAGPTPAVTITPGVPAGLTLNVVGVDTGPPNAIDTPSGAQMLSVYYTGETDASYMDWGDCFGAMAFSSDATQSWSYNNTQASTGYNWFMMTFAMPSAPPTPNMSSIGGSTSSGIAQPEAVGALTSLGAAASRAEAALTGAGALASPGASPSSGIAGIGSPIAISGVAASATTGTAQPAGAGALTAMAASPSIATVAPTGSNPGAFGFIAVSMTSNAEQPAAPVTDYIVPVGESATVATMQAGSPGPLSILAGASSAALVQLAASGLLAAIAAGFTRASVSLTGSGALMASGASGSAGQAQLAGSGAMTAQSASASAATVNGVGLGAGATSARGISISSGQAPMAGAGALSLLATANSAASAMLGAAMPLSLLGASMSIGPGQLSGSFALSSFGASGSGGRAALLGAGALGLRGINTSFGLVQPQGAVQISMRGASASRASAPPTAIPPGVLTAIGLSITSGFVMPHGQTPLVSNPSFVVKLPNGGLTVWLK